VQPCELPAHARPAGEVTAAHGVARERGLTRQEVEARLRRHGPNRLRSTRPRSAWKILLDQFRSVLVLLLATAALLALLFGEWVEALAIGFVLVVNGAIGFASELRAVQSMEALRRLGSVRANVRREGRVQSVNAEELVPGDVLVLEGGDVVTADVRLLEASRLQADESALTGESVPVGKATEVLASETPLAERTNMLFKGTSLTRGAGEGIVVATGIDTELGRISQLVEEAEKSVTPLERRLDRLGQRLLWVTLGIAALVGAAGIAAGRDWLLIVETAIALAVATVPEGLPIIATLALARGMHRMAERNALVKRLSAVETLGATGIVFTDKTGTLTENRMTVAEIALPGGVVQVSGEGLALDGGFRRGESQLSALREPELRRALELGVLCNDASLEDGHAPVGDPLEVALLVAGRKAGLERARLLEERPELREVAFDPEVRMMATLHREGEALRAAVKGAPEAVLAISHRIAVGEGERPLDDAGRRDWQRRNEEMAARGLRVLALATGRVSAAGAEVYRDLTFVGLLGLLDPAREDVREAIAGCRRAGIRVVMVTGDQPATARGIAHAVGLVDGADAPVVHGLELARARSAPESERQRLYDAPIFARISPEQKLGLIAHHQERGAIVAMTGDGVNDAPALKKADIGVAMGRRGTEVAREAADIVLRDDAFATIVAAVQEGRIIFRNIRKFVLYLLSCNLSEIFIVGLASAAAAPLPLLPLQILFLNLVTDVFPALALGMGEGSTAVMQEPPRDPREGVLERSHWKSIAAFGLLITAAVLGAMAIARHGLGMNDAQAVSVSFLTLAFAQLWHVFDMRSPGEPVRPHDITTNGWVWAALALCAGLLLAAALLPGLSDLLRIEPLGREGWLLVTGASLAPLAAGQLLLRLGIAGPGRAAREPAGRPSRP
jgi:Ca2+-transporting ATPase